ncbi:MAG: hypothetical protein M1119_06030, partial [Firmicutes bacterium]|nr:hypothetical protein [Bacillota bacterium]
KLPQRGHSKEKRSDLKIVGLAMMVTPDFNVPLFHEVYPGNDYTTLISTRIIKNPFLVPASPG